MATRIKVTLRPAFVLVIVLTVITGIAYPMLMTGLGHAMFPAQASGSLVNRGASVIGSSLIGQNFTDPRYFWGRPSATTPAPYNAAASTGSNLGPNNPALRDTVRTRISVLRAADPGNPQPVPIDLVTASGSGLDPDISVAAARYQIARVARVRGVDAATVAALIDPQVTGRQLAILGEPRVNVLALNLALDARLARAASAQPAIAGGAR